MKFAMSFSYTERQFVEHKKVVFVFNEEKEFGDF